MLNVDSEKNFVAVNDFYRVRNQVTLREIIARLTGRSTELLSYEEVRQKLRAVQGAEQSIQDIPTDAIVGSVGRYTDFTRDFLPRRDSDRDRWTRVKLAVTELEGLPPIEVYKLGEAYFVIDGNHRVSVARHLGATHIQAYVTEVHSLVSFTPDIQPDDLIIKTEYADFLAETRLNELFPVADLSVTTPGRYPVLLEHINLHRYYLGLEQKRDISFSEALSGWYEDVYMPVIETIRESGILHYYPQRTETDLYLWISKYREELEGELGWHVRPEKAVSDLVSQHNQPSGSIFGRVGGKLLELITPSTLESGPTVGEWRKGSAHVRRGDRLFQDILVPIDGRESGWHALSQALSIAQREGAKIYGLHVVTSGKKRQAAKVQKVEKMFAQHCAEAGIPGSFGITVGVIPVEINSRARWSDLVVTSLSYPPGPKPISRLDSGIRKLIQSCPRPLLVVPGNPSPMNRAILAYDGSAKADEGLFIASYLAAQWRTRLFVMTAFLSESVKTETLLRAQVYLEDQQIEATYLAENPPTAEAIQQNTVDNQIDLIIMGGYGLNPMLEVMLGSTVDQIMRQSQIPLLICR